MDVSKAPQLASSEAIASPCASLGRHALLSPSPPRCAAPRSYRALVPCKAWELRVDPDVLTLLRIFPLIKVRVGACVGDAAGCRAAASALPTKQAMAPASCAVAGRASHLHP